MRPWKLSSSTKRIWKWRREASREADVSRARDFCRAEREKKPSPLPGEKACDDANALSAHIMERNNWAMDLMAIVFPARFDLLINYIPTTYWLRAEGKVG
mmetsp:Transcript_37636/g.90757  ORF Transcript_37636/g.90757 Transcript_37636/m.90757 type:complete len:100 (-) Transcript_37636:64-363(-)